MKPLKTLVNIMVATICGLVFTAPTIGPALITTEALTTTSTQRTIGSFELDSENHATGCILPSEEYYLSQFSDHSSDNEIESRTTLSLPSSVDLSTSPYFPPIGDQGPYKSCVSWATTYYQFTYEAHKLNNITTTASNAYSPRWTFNFTNHGTNCGTDCYEAYHVLQYQGAVTMSDYPYNVTSGFYDWLNNEGAMVNALKTKLTDCTTISLDTAVNQITSNTDTDLNAFKQKLSDGKVLLIDVRDIGNWLYKKTTTNQWAACRTFSSPNADTHDGHSVVIVGYNDNIQCDINGNGTIEACEKGAFKIANSWGTTWQKGNAGFVWVMYDALNLVSANTVNNWENSLPEARFAIFDRYGGSTNRARWITVANQTVNLAAVAQFNTDDCHNVGFITNRSLTSFAFGDTNIARMVAYNYAGNNEILRNYNGPFVLDYGSLDDNIIDYLSGYRWYTRFDNQSATKTVTCLSYKLVDDKDVTVTNSTVSNLSVNPHTTRDFYAILHLQLGDLDYSEELNANDSDLLLSIVTHNTTPSHLQSVLADMDQNGAINIMDVIALNVILTGGNSISSNEIKALYIKYHDYLKQAGIDSFDAFYEASTISSALQ